MKSIALKSFGILAALCLSFSAKSADLIVEEFGLAPTYSSISAAVAAASDGDRILIMNRAGGIPWIEDIIINKSIELHSYENDTFFVVQGNYTILAAANREVTINGMNNTSGNIIPGTGTGPTMVNIYDCHLVSGYLDFDDADFELNVVGSQLSDGFIYLLTGNVIGCDIYNNNSADAIRCQNTGSYTNDTVLIIGNKVYQDNTSSTYHAINARNSTVTFQIRNNYVRHKYYGIRMQYCSSSSNTNMIYNNCVYSYGSSGTHYGIYVNNNPSGSVIEIMNNVVDEITTSSSYGIYALSNSGQVNAYFNHVDASHSSEILGTYTFSSNNTTTGTLSISAASGSPSGSPIDGGNPASSFSDLDLTTGDAGCYGGSYTMNNFFPLFTGSARVFYIDFPFNVRQGSTLKVEGYSYDR